MIRFGIIGTSNIVHRFIRGVEKCGAVSVCGIASRDLSKAEAFVAQYPMIKAYASHDALFHEEQIDAIYIATPNDTHEDFAMRALSCGKHVMCEKPMMLHEDAVKRCFTYAKQQGLILMEAMKPAFLPTTLQAKKWIAEGTIGTLRYISAGYCHNEMTPFLEGWHHDRSLGGGILYDLGVYPIGFVHALLEQEAKDISLITRTLDNGCDIFCNISCRYLDVAVEMLCACDTMMENRALICGDRGYIEIKNFWKSESAVLHTAKGEVHFEEPHDQSEFQYQIRSFCDSIHQHQIENEIMSEEMSRRNAHLVDMIIRKGEQV